jgi:hypothetical protein
VPPRIAPESRRVRAARSARHPVKVQVTGSNPVRGAALALLELRSARHPLKVETTGSNPAQRTPMPSWPRGCRHLPSKQATRVRVPPVAPGSFPVPSAPGGGPAGRGHRLENGWGPEGSSGVRVPPPPQDDAWGNRQPARFWPWSSRFESWSVSTIPIGVIGSPPDSGSGNRGSSPRSGAICARGGTGRRAALRALWPQGRGGSSPSGRTQAGQAAQHHAAVVHHGERQLATLEVET